MNTRIILHGGFHKGATEEENSAFYSEILKDAKDRVNVLLVFFAKDEDRVEKAFRQVSGEFKNVAGKINISFIVADKRKFEDQIKSSDIVYFSGGKTLKLKEEIKDFSNIKELLLGKVVAGESAGANILCNNFYSPSADVVGKGIGLLELNIIPHYTKEYKDKLCNIENNSKNLFLKEYEYKTFII